MATNQLVAIVPKLCCPLPGDKTLHLAPVADDAMCTGSGASFQAYIFSKVSSKSAQLFAGLPPSTSPLSLKPQLGAGAGAATAARRGGSGAGPSGTPAAAATQAGRSEVIVLDCEDDEEAERARAAPARGARGAMAEVPGVRGSPGSPAKRKGCCGDEVAEGMEVHAGADVGMEAWVGQGAGAGAAERDATQPSSPKRSARIRARRDAQQPVQQPAQQQPVQPQPVQQQPVQHQQQVMTGMVGFAPRRSTRGAAAVVGAAKAKARGAAEGANIAGQQSAALGLAEVDGAVC